MHAVCWQDVVSEALPTTPPTPCMLGGHDGDSMHEGAGATEAAEEATSAEQQLSLIHI